MTKKRILIIALDFPPCQSAGVQRTLKFCEYLPLYGWEPTVISAKSLIYDQINNETKLPEWLEKNTHRAFGLNAVKHLSLYGKHFAFTTLPDRYRSWFWHATYIGKRLLDNKNYDLIWSTYPYSTAHKIARYLKAYSGLPWVADFRDPFSGHYIQGNMNKPAALIDSETVRNADLLVYATKRMSELYQDVYEDESGDKFTVIENGYNDDAFINHAYMSQTVSTNNSNELVILYSGELYENGRDPTALFKALRKYQTNPQGSNKSIKIIFRGVSKYQQYSAQVDYLGINSLVEFLPGVRYEASIKEMLESDALLALQGEIFNSQIPGKIYDYLRTCKPVMALVDPNGATADLLRPIKHASIADINSEDEIYSCLLDLPNISASKTYDYGIFSRKKRTELLATYLDEVINE